MSIDVTECLEARGVHFTLKPHHTPVYTSEDAARERGVRLSKIVKTMIAEDELGQVYAAMVPGNRTLKMKQLRQVVGREQVALIPPSELEARLGLMVGAISPIQLLKRGVRFLLDRTVLAEELVTVSAGRPDAGVELSAADLKELLDATVCEIASGTRQER